MSSRLSIQAVYTDEKGKIIGYKVRNLNGISVDVDVDELKRHVLLGDYEFGNAIKCKDGRIKVRSSVPRLRKKFDVKRRKVEKEGKITVYKGDELKSHVKSSGVHAFKQRDFVDTLMSYLNGDLSKNPTYMTKVLGVSGLRGMGKTVGVLQAVYNLNDYNNCVYICLEGVISMNAFKHIIRNYNNYRYIFVDEVTRVQDFVNSSGFLSDSFVNGIRRLVICGTDSYALHESLYNGLFHRMTLLKITHMSFAEARRVLGIDLDDYIKYGGLAVNTGEVTTLEYIDSAITNNVYNTLKRNRDIRTLFSIEGIETLRALIFKIILSVIYSNMKDTIIINFIKYLNQYELDGIRDEEMMEISDKLLSKFGIIQSKIRFSEQSIYYTLRALEKIGFIVRIENIVNSDEAKYYLTNPSIAVQMMLSILDVLDKSKYKRKKSFNIRSTYGLIFESIIMVDTFFSRRYKFYEKYYSNTNGREVDLVITDEGDEVFAFEVKLTDDSDTAVYKTRWLMEYDAADYAIIYRGKNMIFNGFTKPMNDKYNTEQLNMGVQLLNARDFLLSLDRY